MTWPNSFENGQGFPCAEFAVTDWEDMSPQVEETLKALTLRYRGEIRDLTQGDTKLEAIVGGLMVIAANYGAGTGRAEMSARIIR